MKGEFKSFWGVDPETVHEVCLLTPFLPQSLRRALAVTTLEAGALYRVWSGPSYTLVVSQVGAAFCGDAVLQLRHTRCRRVLFFGTCGAVNGSEFSPGTVVSVRSAADLTCFSELLEDRPMNPPRSFAPHGQFVRAVEEAAPGLKSARCLTAGSLTLEDQYLLRVGSDRYDVIDMECAAVFAAAGHAGIQAAAVLTVTDALDTRRLAWALSTEGRADTLRFVSAGAERISALLQALAPAPED